MGLISHSMPNLVNGVSQQPDTLRLDSHAELIQNAYLSVAEGLRKRPPFSHIGNILPNTQVGQAFIHTINRDTTEQYVVVIYKDAVTGVGSIRVFDLIGGERLVTNAAQDAYLNCVGDPNVVFKAVSIADHTFVLNTETATAMNPALTPPRGFEGLVHLRQGSYGKTYTISVASNNTPRARIGATYTTSITDVSTLDTSFIMTQLATQLNNNAGTSGIVASTFNNVIHITNALSDFTVTTTDGLGGQALLTVKGKVQLFSDLPLVAPDGFTVQVSGDAASNFTGYFVKFEAKAAARAYSDGVWVETVAANTPYQLNPTTMPHALVRNADGTFTFKQSVWGERIVGDEISAPQPSFIGSPLRNLFFWKNRLGFLSGVNIVFTQANQFFNLWPNTITALLDDAPIDVSAPTARLGRFHAAIPFNEQLLLFTDIAQFVIQGQGLLTPKTISITQTTEYRSSIYADPVVAGTSVYFATPRGGFSALFEYSIQPYTQIKQGYDVSAHVPKFIHGDILQMSPAVNQGMVSLLSSSERNVIYTYQYYWSGDKKLQSAWHEWWLPAGTVVLSVHYIDTLMFAVVQYPDGVHLLRCQVEDGRTDPWTIQNSPDGITGYVTHLDRRVIDARTTKVFDALTNTTAITLPYAPIGTPTVVRRAVDPALNPANNQGTLIPVVSTAGSVVTVSGDHTLTPFWVGEDYSMIYQFSKPVLKEQASGGGEAPVSTGRLQLRTWQLNFTKTGYFRCEVTPLMRDTSTYVYTSNVLGQGATILGNINLSQGKFRFPVMSRNDRVTIRIVNDSFLPCHIQSAEYEATYTRRTRRA